MAVLTPPTSDDKSDILENTDSQAPINQSMMYRTFSSTTSQVEPKDRYHVVALTMYLFGITSLLPWNFFIQANDYWMFKFRNASLPFDPQDTNKTHLQTVFSSYLAIASKAPYVVFLLVNASISHRYLPSKRIQVPLVVMVLLFLLTTGVVVINTDYHQQAFFAVTITTVVAINAMCGFVQGGGTGIAGSLPKRFMGYNVKGMAVGGILASVAQIFCLLGNSKPTDSAFFYFITAALFLVITFVFFRLTLKSDLYNFYMSRQTSSLKLSRPHDAIKQLSNWKIFKQLWVYAVAIVLLFWVTISVMPAVMVLILSTSKADTIWTGRLFLPTACFLLFNTADLVSRLTAARIPIPSRYKYVTLALAVLRVVFVPLLMFCNAEPRSLPVIFDSDTQFIIINIFFGLTQGYLCNVILTQGPKQVEEEYQEAAGLQMAFFLGLGLLMGSVSSYGLVLLL